MCFLALSLSLFLAGLVFLGHLFLAGAAAGLVLHPLPGGLRGTWAWREGRMEGGRPEDKRVKRKEGGRTHAKLLTKLQNGERQQRGSDEGGFGRPLNCNWEEGDLRWGPDLWVMHQNWSGKGEVVLLSGPKRGATGARMNAGYQRKYFNGEND